MKIFINPGHAPNGEPDPGACGFGLRECDVALNISRLVEKYLLNVGYQVKLFQSDSLQAICDAANDFDADIFVSIHCNAGGGQGTETFCAIDSFHGGRLANYIQEELFASLPVKNRGVKERNFYVLAYTDMPAALVETAFIDNESDATLLRGNQDDFARAIARGISDFFSTKCPACGKPL